MTAPATTPCLTDEAMALLIEGSPRRRERKLWLAHLDTCGDCRTVLAEAAHHAELRTPGRARELTLWARRSWRFGAAAFVLAALVALAVLDPFAGGDRPEVRARDVASALLESTVPARSFAEHRWVSDDATRGFAGASSEAELAFRMGVYLVDLEICQAAGRSEAVDDIRAELSALGRLSGAEGEPDSLSGLAREAAALGAWSEAGRLAAARDHAPFFSSEAFVRTRDQLDRESMTAQIRSELEIIDDVLARGLGGRASEGFDELERAFTQIILLH